MNKYETGERDSYGNRNFNMAKAFADLKKVVLGKAKFTKALYDVMHLRFTIAHYDRYGWLDYYNGNWGELANEIKPLNYGDFVVTDRKPYDDINSFLKKHSVKYIDIDAAV